MVKNPHADVADIRDVGSISGSGKPPGKGNGNPPQNSALENSMDREACRLQSIRSLELDMTKHTHTHAYM